MNQTEADHLAAYINRSCTSRILVLGMIIVTWLTLPASLIFAQEALPNSYHPVTVGDTWAAISRRYTIDESELRAANPTINRQSQPVIGTQLIIPASEIRESTGVLLTSNDGGLLQLSVQHNQSPWLLTLTNGLANPNRPLLYRPILIPDNETSIRQLPPGIDSLELSSVIGRPGEALAIRASGPAVQSLIAYLDNQTFTMVTNGERLIGLLGTGAFYPPGHHELQLSILGKPLWSQPWHFAPGEWSFDDITLSGTAAAIDSSSIEQEYQRLSQIWSEVSARPNWVGGFESPIDEYLSISSEYGARRSYNGGPYRTYHEGLDFSAYGGSEVKAPAAGNIVVAENLYVRGGAVIIDHGLGLYSGTYHLEEVLVQPDQSVERGQLIGLVGSTGLSTGNHLHWDLLVGGVWVSPQAWLDADLACWILEGWGTKCQSETGN